MTVPVARLKKIVLGGRPTVPLHDRFTQLLEEQKSRPLVLTCHLDLPIQNLALLVQKHPVEHPIEHPRKSVKERLGRPNTGPRMGPRLRARLGVRPGPRLRARLGVRPGTRLGRRLWDVRGLRYPLWYLKWKYGWTVGSSKKMFSWKKRLRRAPPSGDAVQLPDRYEAGGRLAPAGPWGDCVRRGGAWRGGAVLSRAELDAELEDYMSMSKSRLDAELEDYMNMPGDSWL